MKRRETRQLQATTDGIAASNPCKRGRCRAHARNDQEQRKGGDGLLGNIKTGRQRTVKPSKNTDSTAFKQAVEAPSKGEIALPPVFARVQYCCDVVVEVAQTTKRFVNLVELPVHRILLLIWIMSHMF